MRHSSVAIMLVEDDEVDAMNVQRAFKKVNIGNVLYHAQDGMEALAMLRGEDGYEKMQPMPTIILLDINMPRMNGHEFLRELRQDKELKHTCVVVLSTSNEESDLREAYAQNVAGYVVKPVVPEEFINAVSTLDVYWNLIELP